MYDNDTKEKVWICFFKESNLEVKEMLDVSKSTVYKWLREEGYNRDTKKILQNINNLWNSNEYDKALELVNLYQEIPLFERYQKYLTKQLSKKINDLISTRQWDSALKLCSMAPENFIVISQQIKILILQRKFKEALTLCTEENCHENPSILSQKIKILIKLDRTEDALALCTEEICRENPIILVQKVQILQKMRRQEEALLLCEQNKQTPMILSLYQSILETISIENPDQKIILPNTQNESFEKTDVTEVIMMLAHLYHNSCTISMIENSSLSAWEKILLKIGYYERNHSKRALSILKKEIAEHQFDKEQLKILKQSLERVKSSSSYFDIAYYNHLLCGKSLIAFPELEQEKTQVAKKPITEPLTNVSRAKKEKSSKAPKHYVTSIELTTAQSVHEKNIAKKQNKKEKLEKKVLLLKDAYRERIYRTQLKLYKYLYMEKTKEQAIRVWDYIEELKNRPATEENKELLLKLLVK